MKKITNNPYYIASLNKLKNNGFRITEQRIEIIENISKFTTPFTAEELHKSLNNKKINLSTIYRTLSNLLNLETLNSINFSDGSIRYEHKDFNQKGHHHHIICTVCKKIEKINTCLINHIQNKEIARLGYKDISHKLEFFGTCKRCL